MPTDMEATATVVENTKLPWPDILKKTGYTGTISTIATALGSTAFNHLFGVSSYIPFEKMIQAPIAIAASGTLAYLFSRLASEKYQQFKLEHPPKPIQEKVIPLPERVLNSEIDVFCEESPKGETINRIVASKFVKQMLNQLSLGQSLEDFLIKKMGEDSVAVPEEIQKYLFESLAELHNQLEQNPHTPPDENFSKKLNHALQITDALVSTSEAFTEDKLWAIMELKVTRRKFLKSMALTAALLPLAKVGSSLAKVSKSIFARPMPREESPDVYIDQNPTSEMFANSIVTRLDRLPPERLKTIFNFTINATNPTALNRMPYDCFNALGSNATSLSFAKYSLNYTSEIVERSQDYGISPEFTLSLLDRSYTYYRNPAKDTRQSREQILYHTLTHWGKSLNLPVAELGQAFASRQPSNPSEESIPRVDLIRACGIPTFWSADVEPEIYAMGILNDPNLFDKLRSIIDSQDFSKFEINANELITSRRNYEADKARLISSIDRYIEVTLTSHGNDISQTIFKDFFTEKSENSWAEISLGSNAGFLDQLSQVSHYSLTWEFVSNRELSIPRPPENENLILSGIKHTQSEIRNMVKQGNPKLAIKTLIMDQLFNNNHKMIDWLEAKDLENQHLVKNIINLKANSDISGELVRTHNQAIMDALAPYEYNIECQKIAQISHAKYLHDQLNKNQFLAEIAKDSPAWQTFLLLAARDSASTPISSGLIDQNPIDASYELPYREKVVFSQLEKIIREYQSLGLNSSGEILNKLLEDLSYAGTPDNEKLVTNSNILTLMKSFFGDFTGSIVLHGSLYYALEILRHESP